MIFICRRIYIQAIQVIRYKPLELSSSEIKPFLTVFASINDIFEISEWLPSQIRLSATSLLFPASSGMHPE